MDSDHLDVYKTEENIQKIILSLPKNKNKEVNC